MKNVNKLKTNHLTEFICEFYISSMKISNIASATYQLPDIHSQSK